MITHARNLKHIFTTQKFIINEIFAQCTTKHFFRPDRVCLIGLTSSRDREILLTRVIQDSTGKVEDWKVKSIDSKSPATLSDSRSDVSNRQFGRYFMVFDQIVSGRENRSASYKSIKYSQFESSQL